MCIELVNSLAGHVIAQEVSHWLPIPRPGFEPGSDDVGFVFD
jgi:hypothetical protein